MKKPFIWLVVSLFLLGNTQLNKSYYTIPLTTFSISTADLDNDGDQDIISGHNLNNSTMWSGVARMENNSGYFALIDSIYMLGWQESIFAVNLDDNPLPEIVAKSESFSSQQDYIGIIFNNDPENIETFSLNSNSHISKISPGYINGDTSLDLVVISYPGEKWGVLYNNGYGSFSTPSYESLGGSPTDVTCGNLNNDSKSDIVIGGGDINIYLSSDQGFELTVFDFGTSDVFIDDFDNDGDNDVIGITGMYTWNSFSYMENIEDGTFIQHPDTTTHPGCLDFCLSDLNNDGLSEILSVANNMSGIYIFYNNGNFHISDPVFVPVEYLGEDSRLIHSDDLDNNGYNDIILARRHGYVLSSNLVVLFNDSNGNFMDDPITLYSESFKDGYYKLNCFPNPFTTATTISLNFSKPSLFSIKIYDSQGNIVFHQPNQLFNELTFKYIWDGKDITNQVIDPGIYTVIATINNQSIITYKLIRI